MAENTLTRFPNLVQCLREVAADAQEIYKYQISLGGKNASRALSDSAKCHVDLNGTCYEVKIDLLEYWKYVEGGAKGTETSPAGAVWAAHFPPTRVIEDWISVKPVIPQPMANGKLPSIKSLAFLIARSISRRGIEPYPALQTTIEDVEKQWVAKIEEAFAKDVEGWLSDEITILAGRGL
jgi:hypothetical protein